MNEEQMNQQFTSTVSVYSDDYNGGPPPTNIEGLKVGDQAMDISCSVLWEYTGVKWCRKAFTNGGKIYISAGRTIREMIAGRDTKGPGWMTLYAGDDIRVPRSLQLAADNLVIQHRMSEPPIMAAAYYNANDGKWYNIQPRPGELVTVEAGGWTMWIGYRSRVANNKSILSIWDIGSQTKTDTRSAGAQEEGGGGGGGGGGSILSPADELPRETVENLSMLSAKLTVENDKVVIINGADKDEVRARTKTRITSADLDVNKQIKLDYHPDCIISGAGKVVHMNSTYDSNSNKYILDFSDIVMRGVWVIIH